MRLNTTTKKKNSAPAAAKKQQSKSTSKPARSKPNATGLKKAPQKAKGTPKITAALKPEDHTINSVLIEKRVLKPIAAFSKKAHIKSMAEYEKIYRSAEKNPEAYWAKVASEFHWFKKWSKVLEWKSPYAKWFVGGTTNICYNALDRHLTTYRKNKAAIIWEAETGEVRTLTYLQLHREVSKCANVITRRGIQKGDRVAIYMGMSPELVIAALACARIGAVHSIVFGGFSAQALADRINDAEAKMVICADGVYRRGSFLNLKATVDEALVETPTVQNVIVYQRGIDPPKLVEGRDHLWHDLMSLASEEHLAEHMNSEDPLFILYTSGSTGKPKGILHTTAGYMVHAANSHKLVFDIKDDDIYWCTADVGWITGHSYITYGPLINGATVVMFEGAVNFPNWGRVWEMIERHKVTILYTAPTAIRSFIKAGDEWVTKRNLSSLRLLGTVGEPINPEAWMWFYNVVGGKRCPIVDTWWQTETGGIMVSPLPGATPLKPGTATRPLPGIAVDVVRKDGTSCKPNEGGYLVVKKPWPSMLRTIFRDNGRYEKTYWSELKGMYFTGDGARKDSDGYIWIMGRVDDVVNVSGHRLGTSEVESALVAHPSVAESAVVSRPDTIKGNALIAFVSLKEGFNGDHVLKEELRDHVAREIGSIAKPDDIRFASGLPKTRSGKIMRRLLRELAAGGEVKGDTSTLEDFSILEKLRQGEEE